MNERGAHVHIHSKGICRREMYQNQIEQTRGGKPKKGYRKTARTNGIIKREQKEPSFKGNALCVRWSSCELIYHSCAKRRFRNLETREVEAAAAAEVRAALVVAALAVEDDLTEVVAARAVLVVAALAVEDDLAEEVAALAALVVEAPAAEDELAIAAAGEASAGVVLAPATAALAAVDA